MHTQYYEVHVIAKIGTNMSLASSGVDRGFEPRSVQTKDYTIGICCFSAEDAPLRSKSKYWLIRNQDNVSEWSHMSTLLNYFNKVEHTYKK
jgi:hypothetical protein